VEKCHRDREVADENITRRLRIACWISKATDTHSEYIIGLRIPCPFEQCLRESGSVCVLPLLIHINSIGLRLNPGHRVGILVTNRLRHGVRPALKFN
jgi:hypothetical protein